MEIKNKTTNIYTEWKPLIDGLSDSEAGKLLKDILKYQSNEEVKNTNPVWFFIKSKIDEYNDRLESIIEKRQKSGRLGGIAKASKCQQMLANDGKSSNKIKENKIKENKIKELYINVENLSLKEELEKFIEFRKEIKKPLTQSSLESNIQHLNKLSTDVNEQIEIIEQSIRRGWQGLFPLKEKQGIEEGHHVNSDELFKKWFGNNEGEKQ